MPLSPDIFRDAPGRFELFKDLFDALDVLGDEGTAVSLVTRTDMDWILSRLVMAALGKVLKTLQATQRLCLLGYGEDAALLLRANINLLINLNYIVGDAEPNERARDLQAYTHTESMKWYAAAAERSGMASRGLAAPFESGELEMRAKRWSSVGIRARATRTHQVHYAVGYRFYSSLEHSDIVLGHTFAVVADILECIWRFFRADSREAEERIRLASQKIYPQPPPR